MSSSTYEHQWVYSSPMAMADVLSRDELEVARSEVLEALESGRVSGREAVFARLELEMLEFALWIQGDDQ